MTTVIKNGKYTVITTKNADIGFINMAFINGSTDSVNLVSTKHAYTESGAKKQAKRMLAKLSHN